MKRICIVVADAARARIFTYEQLREPDGLHEQLREECDLVDQARRQRPRELFSDKAGSGNAGTHSFGRDDHRDDHLDRLDAQFARDVIAQIESVAAQGYHHLVLVASSRMLGELRAHLDSVRRTMTVEDLERDFTKLGTAEIRERLADLALLPPRARFAVAAH